MPVFRLVNGPTQYERRVEVYYNGQFGTVCDNEWDFNDAKVICSQLMVHRLLLEIEHTYCGQGSGQIGLDYIPELYWY